MGWMDDLLGKTIQKNGSIFPDRKLLNFMGAGVSITDNPVTESTDVVIDATSNVGKDPLVPQSNAGTSAYPTNPTYTIGTGITFVRSGLADYDSVRFFGAGGSEPVQVAYSFGQVINLSGFVLALYPLLTQHLYVMGVDYGAGAAIDIAPGSAIRWALDASLNAHIQTS